MPLKAALISINRAGYYSQAIRVLKLYAEDQPDLAGRVAVSLFEACTATKEVGRIVDKAAATEPDVIGLSCNVWNVAETFCAVRGLRARCPRAMIVVGGQEVTNSAIDYASAHPDVDLFVDGEGEICFAEILRRRLAGRTDLHEVPGVWCLRDGDPVRTGPAPALQALDDVPSPVLNELVDHRRNRGLGVMIEGTRGCPCRCRFCVEGKRFSRSRSFSVDRIAREIAFMADRGAWYFHLMDPILCNANTERLQALHGALLDHGVRPGQVRIGVEAYAERLKPEHLPYLEHVSMVDVGLQTTGAEASRNILRPLDLDRFVAGVKLLQSAGKEVNIYLIHGLPGDTLETFRAGIRFAVSLDPTRLFLNDLCLLNGTALRDLADEFGIRAAPDPPYRVIETRGFDALSIRQARALSATLMRTYNTWRPSLEPADPLSTSMPDPAAADAEPSAAAACGGDSITGSEALMRHLRINVGGRCSDDRCLTTPDAPTWRSEASVRKDLEPALGRRILFVGGDPLEHPKCARLIGAARLAGAAQIGLYTPLCRLDDADRARKLVRLGATLYVTPLYGPDAATHDACSGLAGGFDRTMKAIENLRSISLDDNRASAPVIVVVAPVLPGGPVDVAAVTRTAVERCVDAVRIDVRDPSAAGPDLAASVQRAIRIGLEAQRWVSVAGLRTRMPGPWAPHEAGWLFSEIDMRAPKRPDRET